MLTDEYRVFTEQDFQEVSRNRSLFTSWYHVVPGVGKEHYIIWWTNGPCITYVETGAVNDNGLRTFYIFKTKK